ncbi:biliverdin-producing heme oxygenase [Sphingobacteriaceae bacterium WQ 2009]|uniref:Biliverdin-producing heme oxygenase n=1 Tax=Rhinopithecimicrobium faecis TaxID=2820698 RepID=A0A8T4H5H9_9SPHI|nr:biliverdin-producing heme oxygenase [Sphingobacteriaceae bacterium WQ 2009]
MLSEQIKNATKSGHQELEKTVILKLKAIRSKQDYAEVLKYFYAYFTLLEKKLNPFIPAALTPYYSLRRDASYIERDIIELGASLENLPSSYSPEITTVHQAIGALYVLEGSIMGGPYIVKMLQQYGMDQGFNFFQGYGDASQGKWQEFTSLINTEITNPKAIEEAIEAAKDTFNQFSKTFKNELLTA